jgi:hypothetical protein
VLFRCLLACFSLKNVICIRYINPNQSERVPSGQHPAAHQMSAPSSWTLSEDACSPLTTTSSLPTTITQSGNYPAEPATKRWAHFWIIPAESLGIERYD